MKNPKNNPDSHYIHRMPYSFQERVVGTFILLAMIILLGLLLATGKTKYLFEDRITLYGVLPSAQGISQDNTIRVAGIEGGYISSIDISPQNEVIVTMRIFKRFHRLLREDSVASIRSHSLFGGASGGIELTAGSPDKPLLQDQAKIAILAGFSMDELTTTIERTLRDVQQTIAELSAIVTALHPERFSSAVEDMGRFAGNLQEISGRLAGGGGLLGAAIYNDALQKDFQEGISSLWRMTKEMEARLRQLEPALEGTEGLSGSIQQTLENFPALIKELKQTVVQVNSMLMVLDSEVQQLPDLVARVRLLIDDSDRTLRAAQRIWPLSRGISKSTEQPYLITPQPAHE